MSTTSNETLFYPQQEKHRRGKKQHRERDMNAMKPIFHLSGYRDILDDVPPGTAIKSLCLSLANTAIPIQTSQRLRHLEKYWMHNCPHHFTKYTNQLPRPQMILNTHEQCLLICFFPLTNFYMFTSKQKNVKSSQLNWKFYIIAKDKVEQSTCALEWEKNLCLNLSISLSTCLPLGK